MIGKANRFHGLGSLRPVYTHGRAIRGQIMSTKYLLNNRRSSYRIAVVVSKKVHKSAVVRNRIRRRLYEIIRQESGRITKPYDIVVSVYQDKAATIPSPELAEALIQQLTQAGVLS